MYTWAIYRMFMKRRAKEVMKNGFLQCIGAALVLTAIFLLFSMLASALALSLTDEIDYRYVFIITGISAVRDIVAAPALLGLIEFLYRKLKGAPAKISDVFVWMGNGTRFLKSVSISFLYLLLSFLWMLVYAGIPIVLAVAVVYFSGNMNTSAASGIFNIITFLIAVTSVLAVAKTYTYSAANILLAKDDTKGPIACLKESSRLLKPRKWEFFVFNLSFILWFVIGNLAFSGSIFGFIISGAIMGGVYAYYYLSVIQFVSYAENPDELKTYIRSISAQLAEDIDKLEKETKAEKRSHTGPYDDSLKSKFVASEGKKQQNGTDEQDHDSK